MKLFNRKSRLDRFLDSLESNDALKSAAITGVESAVAGATSKRQAEKLGKALDSFDFGNSSKVASSIKKKAKSGLIVMAGAAAVTAASASVSSLRRRESDGLQAH